MKDQPESLTYYLRNAEPAALRTREEVQPGKGKDTRRSLLDYLREKGREILEAEAEKTKAKKKGFRRRPDPAGAVLFCLRAAAWRDLEEIRSDSGWSDFLEYIREREKQPPKAGKRSTPADGDRGTC